MSSCVTRLGSRYVAIPSLAWPLPQLDLELKAGIYTAVGEHKVNSVDQPSFPVYEATLTVSDVPSKVSIKDVPNVGPSQPAEIGSTSQMTTSHDTLRTSSPLDIIVVGCGLGGLAAAHCLGRVGHRVTVLDQAQSFGEIGAGIQVSPNVTRLIQRWGGGEQLERHGIRTQGFGIYRYCTGEELSWSPMGDTIVQQYGSPYYHVHRADLHRILYDLAKPYANFRHNARVVQVDPSTPTVTLQSGEVLTGDVIIAADGVRSMIREIVVGAPIKAMPTGDAAYRATIPVSQMLKDPELKPLVDKSQMNVFIGPRRHVVMYKIRSTDWNVVMAHPDDGSTESWTALGDTAKAREEFSDFAPCVRKVLDLVPHIMNWKLMAREPLSKWVHDDGKVALLGDACHPMLPYRAQGAAMAVEDAAVLGVLFGHLSNRSEIGPLLRAYQDIRYPRASKTQRASQANRHTFHLEDGPEQIARDQKMAEAMRLARASASADNSGNPNLWLDKKVNAEQYGYDAELAAEQWWEEHKRDLSAKQRL